MRMQGKERWWQFQPEPFKNNPVPLLIQRPRALSSSRGLKGTGKQIQTTAHRSLRTEPDQAVETVPVHPGSEIVPSEQPPFKKGGWRSACTVRSVSLGTCPGCAGSAGLTSTISRSRELRSRLWLRRRRHCRALGGSEVRSQAPAWRTCAQRGKCLRDSHLSTPFPRAQLQFFPRARQAVDSRGPCRASAPLGLA